MKRKDNWPWIRLRRIATVLACLLLASAWLTASYWDQPKRLRVVVPGRLIGGAWQSPAALGSIIDHERIRTIVTLTAINHDDPKYVSQSKVVARTAIDWILVPMRGSTATLEQMAQAADLMAEPARQPVYFHCVAGHHRTSLAHAAYLIRHAGYSGEQAWAVVAGLPWARPGAPADERDRRLILEFARVQASIVTTPPAPEALGRP
ncbi:MAG: protein-tyrosine phosphatase family protein [Isosphaeraceae bacterium]